MALSASFATTTRHFLRGILTHRQALTRFWICAAGRGFVLINGFNIGRFWEIGPQYTLYVPGGLIKEKDNEIVVFDVNRIGTPKIGTLDHAILEGE